MLDFLLRFLSRRDHVALGRSFSGKEKSMFGSETRPIELGEVIGLARVGVGQAHGVTAAPVKRLAEMQNFRAAFAAPRGQVLPDLPIHGGLERVFNGEGAALDEEVALERRQTRDAHERLHKFRVGGRVNVGVRDFDLRARRRSALTSGALEIRMIESDRHRSEKAVEIDQTLIVDLVIQIVSRGFSRD